jgi:hypothetical protein
MGRRWNFNSELPQRSQAGGYGGWGTPPPIGPSWVNKGTAPCVIASVLVAAKPSPSAVRCSTPSGKHECKEEPGSFVGIERCDQVCRLRIVGEIVIARDARVALLQASDGLHRIVIFRPATVCSMSSTLSATISERRNAPAKPSKSKARSRNPSRRQCPWPSR